MPNPAPCSDPIFILGILGRSGTNFLSRLLRLHPDCTAPDPIAEDFLVYYSDLLASYADSLYKRWSRWGTDGLEKDSIFQHLGNALVSWLSTRAGGKRLLTKTPSVRNLENFFKLFPKARLVILVRDGRAVVESGVRSFGWNYEVATRDWVRAARTILQFDQAHKNSGGRYLIVRYEELYSNLSNELVKILEFLGLNPETYDFEAAVNMPVWGSSSFRGEASEKVHWQPIRKNADFKPMERSESWGRARQERFDWIAGEYLQQLGYKKKERADARLLWSTWNVLLDIRWRVKTWLRSIRIKLRRASASGPKMDSRRSQALNWVLS